MILIVLEVLIILFNYSLYDINSLLHIPYENGFLICYMTQSREKMKFLQTYDLPKFIITSCYIFRSILTASLTSSIVLIRPPAMTCVFVSF